MEQVNRSVERILKVKARLGLHRTRATDLNAIDTRLGGRTNQRVAAEIAERALTLVKDDRNQVPLTAPADTSVLYLSVIDYASGWREGAPSRSIIPALKERWPNLVAVEISDRTTASEYDLVRALARRSNVVIAGVFVRIASYSGRMDLSPAQVSLVEWLSGEERPFVAVVFGNPYVVSAIPKVPAVLVAYEFGDAPELAAARALGGEIAIGGKLPITLPGLFPYGHGLARTARQ
jgi:beta-N-acetylhexosaminidase